MSCLHCFIFLVSVIGVMMFNILDSILKFLRKKYTCSFSFTFCWMETDPAPAPHRFLLKTMNLLQTKARAYMQYSTRYNYKKFCDVRVSIHCRSLAIGTVQYILCPYSSL
jgi:hypothetical protein